MECRHFVYIWGGGIQDTTVEEDGIDSRGTVAVAARTTRIVLVELLQYQVLVGAGDTRDTVATGERTNDGVLVVGESLIRGGGTEVSLRTIEWERN